jgi:hypothetical protein
VTLTATVAADSVALGTDTTGNYVATIAGTANQITVGGAGTESSAVTLSLPQDIAFDSNVMFNNITVGDNNIHFADFDETGIASITGWAGIPTASIFNEYTTTVNLGGAATTVSIGAGSGTTTVNNALVVTGDLTVNGTTTTVNTTTVSVDDKNIELGAVTTPTDVTADGGGITLKGATDKTIIWVDATDCWTFNQDVDLASGKAYKINGTTVIGSTSLGAGVTSSNLDTVATIGTGTWQASTIAGQYGGTGVANTGKTITLGGNVTTSGAYAVTFTLTGTTSVTMPTSGTVISDTTTNLISDNDQLILASQIFGR